MANASPPIAPPSAKPPRGPLQRELLLCLGLHVAAIAAGAVLPFASCVDGCGEGVRIWTLVPGVALLALAATAAASEIGRSLAASSDGWVRWAGLLFIVGALTATALAFLYRPSAAPDVKPLQRGLAIILLAAASNAILALAGAGIARWVRRSGDA